MNDQSNLHAINPPIVIGVVGGIASGKSKFAASMKSLGAGIIDADAIAHDILSRSEVILQLKSQFGEEIVVDGRVNRSELAKAVFDSEEKEAMVEKLEAITHPPILASMEAALQKHTDDGCEFVVVDAPLLFEAKWDQRCDAIVFIDTPRRFREQRTAARGWSAEQFAARENAQLGLAEKKARSDYIVDGSLDDSSLLAECRNLMSKLRKE